MSHIFLALSLLLVIFFSNKSLQSTFTMEKTANTSLPSQHDLPTRPHKKSDILCVHFILNRIFLAYVSPSIEQPQLMPKRSLLFMILFPIPYFSFCHYRCQEETLPCLKQASSLQALITAPILFILLPIERATLYYIRRTRRTQKRPERET